MKQGVCEEHLKIAVYKDTLANNRGADVAVRNLVEGLAERGHAVTLITRDEFAAKIRGGYDVIVSTGTNEILDLAEVDGLPPIVQQFHTDPAYPFRHWIRKWRRNRAIKAALKKVSAIQILRGEHRTTLGKLGISAAHIEVIGNWSSFQSNNRTIEQSNNVIVYPAAVNKDKNQRLLVAAFDTLKREFPDWRLELYGKGTPNGFCDLGKVYSDCAFVAFPSKTEGFPLTLADAAAFGKPAVMIRDWIGTCAAGGGIVTEPTVRAFAAGLRRLMADEPLRRQMGACARAYCAEHYSREKILDRWEAVLNSFKFASFKEVKRGHLN